ncbi:hypothetical protein JZ751_021184 [Albula glossodonta]|uniref:Uncharacterized protein n=1 Tax=Albula glossodonta TaxID=121402 RepID=A0A8T2NSV6_9TELE|nr:hypothetical protein JZ751_021184 [Albula glossodonta]
MEFPGLSLRYCACSGGNSMIFFGTESKGKIGTWKRGLAKRCIGGSKYKQNIDLRGRIKPRPTDRRLNKTIGPPAVDWDLLKFKVICDNATSRAQRDVPGPPTQHMIVRKREE